MTDAGFFRGTSTEQDVRFSDKDKKLLKTMKFDICLEQKVDLHKVNFEALKPWVSEQVTRILGIEDEVVVELIFSFLEHERFPNAKKLQILVTGFLQSKPARLFIGQLWGLLLSAQENPSKLPEKFIEDKKNAIRQQKKRIEMELNIRDDSRRYSPDRDEFYKRPHGRYRGSPRSPPHGRTSDRRDKGNLSDVGTQVQKSEASSTQAELEQPGPTSASTLSRVENMIKSVEQVMQHHNKDVYRGADLRREEHRERNRTRSRSYSPGRRHRSRSRERGESRERRYRPRRSRQRSSLSPFSPDSHSHRPRGRGHGRESPYHSRPLRSPENRHRQEGPMDQHRHTEHQHQGSTEKHRQSHIETQDSRSDPKESHILPTQDSHIPPVKTRRSQPQTQEKGTHPSKEKSPRVHRESRSGRNTREGREASNSSTSSSSSSSSGSASPARERARPRREGRTRKKSSFSSSASSESDSDSQHRHRQAHSKHITHAKPSREATPVSRREVARESSKRGSAQAKRKSHSHSQHRMSPASEKSEHTSENFSELEQQRKSSLRLKRQKQVSSSKRKPHQERSNVSVKSKVRRPQKKRRESVERRVVAPKRKQTAQRQPSSEISDESEDNSEVEEVNRNVLKRKQRQVSPAATKKPRYKKSLTLDSSSVSSESEDSSSSESDSEEQRRRRRDKRKEKGPGKERRRIRDDSSGVESLGRDRERGSIGLEKHLRGKIIQRQRQRKNKN